MKREFLLIFMLLPLMLHSQQYIVPKYDVPFGYDSSTNYINMSEKEVLLGQNLFVVPRNFDNAKEDRGYHYFFSRVPAIEDFASEKSWLTLKNPAAVYAPSKNNIFVSNPTKLMERTFRVIGVEKVAYRKLPHQYETFWKLTDDKGDTLYYGYPIGGESGYIEGGFPFLIEGYFKKMTQKWLNKTLILTQDLRMNDFETGVSVSIKSGSKLVLKESTVALIGNPPKTDVGFLAKIENMPNTLFISNMDLPDISIVSYENGIYKWIPEYVQEYIDKKEWDMLKKGELVQGLSPYSVKILMGKPPQIHAYLDDKGKQVLIYQYGLEQKIFFVDNKLVKIEKK